MTKLLSVLFISLLATSAEAQTLSPANKAKDICPDTHLTLTFPSSVSAGKSGKIRVYDKTARCMVDSLDLSIPAGPTQSRTYPASCDYTKIPYDYSRTFMPTNRTTTPGTPSGTAELTPPDYQLNIIGGFTDAFHFYPVIAKGNTATIYLHNNVLEYGHKYSVSIDREALVCKEFNGIRDWTFTTRRKAPQGTSVSVDASGNGDFCTVQGALDYVPDWSQTTYTISISEGEYEELVYARNKTNVVIMGAGMDKTHVHYANNEVFNPHPMTVKTNERPGTFPSRRAAFALDNCRNITIRDITIATDLKGQAEGLLIMGEHFLLDKVHIIGSGDAIQANGTIFMNECELDGDADAFLSRGSLYAYRCNLRNDGGPFTWVRNTEGHHGLVFVECSFSTNNGRPVNFGRCPENKGSKYPHAEMVLIDCKTATVIPEGWSQLGEPTVNMAEYRTTEILTGKPADVSQRHPYSRQLDSSRDAETISNYRSPAYILDGWDGKQSW